jgi:multiphosphoryl transfer protein
VKIVLTEALHARPANLLVRLAMRQAAEIELRKGAARADARKILDVLALGAVKGEEIAIEAHGDDADGAVRAVVELIEGGFSADLVPEVGSAAVEGIAIGRAIVAMAEPEIPSGSRGMTEEMTRARNGVARVEDELAQLIAALPESEAALFEPERAIVRDAASRIEAEIANGTSAEQAVVAVLGSTATDLIADARARLLDTLAGTDSAALGKVRSASGGDLVLVTDRLTPSLVASLPARVRGIVAARDDAGDGAMRTSHAAILARSRGVPLAIVAPHVGFTITDGDEVVVDTTTARARVWIAPDTPLVAEARARQRAIDRAREDDARVGSEFTSRLGVELWVNVGTLHERLPRSAHGVGLLRTELLFAARSAVPTEDEQHAVLVAIARGAHGKVVTARLFDAGGDKPLAWLPSRADQRGIALLFAHPSVLAAQVRALVRAAGSSAIRALLPMCRSAADVRSARALAPSLEWGAMIETPEAARDAAAIAGAADFVCIGTNDLAPLVLGARRADGAHALHPRVLAAVADVVHAAHAHRRRVTVCGEVAADPRGARVLIGLGVDALSVAPARFADVARTLSATTLDECRAAAEAALSEVP